jgi:pimeloyl-ACP methyl ester carboxylesterase
MHAAGTDVRTSVVLVNGLWMPDVGLWLLARRLRRAGFRTHTFSYPTVREDLRRNAQRLQTFLHTIPGDTVHLVGFSLGGLVVRALFRQFPAQRPGRILLLGSPQQGSRAAAALAASCPGRFLLGRSLADLNAGHPQAWTWPEREIGVIAGSLALGLGRLVVTLPTPNDGTVSVDETGMPEARDRLTLPVTHSGLLLSNEVARQAAGFLHNGRFAR